MPEEGGNHAPQAEEETAQEEDITTVPLITNDEVLYRSIWLRPECFYLDEEGHIHVGSQAFADRHRQPSLYRHVFCDSPPHSKPPRMGDDDAVVSLMAGRIRESDPIEHRPEKAPQEVYIVDVIPDLSDGQHRSHSIVITTPLFTKDRPFEKLKIRLASLIEAMDIPPPTAFIEKLPSK